LIRGERNYDYAPAPALHFVGADDRAFSVVAAFHYDVRLENPDEFEGRVLRENNDQIDTFHGGEHERALGSTPDRSARAFEPAHGLIAVDADDQRIRGRAGCNKKIDVTGMEQIENSVGKRYPIFSCGPPTLGVASRGDFRGRIPRSQSLLIAMGWKWTTRSFLSGRVTTSS
jgi:hypothetical protein